MLKTGKCYFKQTWWNKNSLNGQLSGESRADVTALAAQLHSSDSWNVHKGPSRADAQLITTSLIAQRSHTFPVSYSKWSAEIRCRQALLNLAGPARGSEGIQQGGDVCINCMQQEAAQSVLHYPDWCVYKYCMYRTISNRTHCITDKLKQLRIKDFFFPTWVQRLEGDCLWHKLDFTKATYGLTCVLEQNRQNDTNNAAVAGHWAFNWKQTSSRPKFSQPA